MTTAREQQLGPITVLDESSSGTVTASGAKLTNVAGLVNTPVASTPGNSSFWVQSGSPTLPKFTNSSGSSITLGTGGGGTGSLAQTLANGNATDGYDIIMSAGDYITSTTDVVLDPDGYTLINGYSASVSEGTLAYKTFLGPIVDSVINLSIAETDSVDVILAANKRHSVTVMIYAVTSDGYEQSQLINVQARTNINSVVTSDFAIIRSVLRTIIQEDESDIDFTFSLTSSGLRLKLNVENESGLTMNAGVFAQLESWSTPSTPA